MEQLKVSGEEVKVLDTRLREIEAALDELALTIPNFPHDQLPDGDASANRLLRSWGSSAGARLRCAAPLGAGRVAGAARSAGRGQGRRLRLSPLHRDGSRLGRALANFMLDLHTREHGYLEIAPPYLVNRATLTGTGQLPKFAEEVYASPADDLFLIPTAEVPVTNIHRDEILEASALPATYVAVLSLLPARGRLRREGHPRADPGSPVRQGGAGPARAARRTRRRSTSESPATPKPCSSVWSCPTGSWSSPRATPDSPAPGPMISKSGLPESAAGSRSPARAPSPTSRLAGRTSATGRPPRPSPSSSTPSTLPASPSPVRLSPYLENNQAADGSVRVPAALVPYLGVDRLTPRA